jgi:isopentenyl diphosphate isomerase/L-lactate dehydrogenase-like FMN-dependent dehydrogenase
MTRQFPTLADIVREAQLNVSPRLWNYIVGGANGELSLEANRAAFAAWEFLPEMFAGITKPDLSTSLLGMPMSMPVFISPFAYDLAMHPRGYREVAEAVAEAGITGFLSESTSSSLEALAPAFGDQRGMVQFALAGPDEHAYAFIDRIQAAGYRGVLLTDVPSSFWRERSLEAGLDLHTHYGAGNYGPGLASDEVHRAHRSFETPRWDWERVEKLVARIDVPWMFKGVLTAQDARRSVDLGADAVYVSNFGARNLDSMPPALARLPLVLDAVAGAVPVLIDSGFRRGTDILKALALGASAVGVGRLGAVALAAGGKAGVTALLELLRSELAAAIGVLGCSSLADLGPQYLSRAEAGGAIWQRTSEGSFLDITTAGPLPLI